MQACIFCKIVQKEIPSSVVYEDENTVAFLDIAPQAPVHIVVIPKAHYRDAEDADSQNGEILGQLMHAAVQAARGQGLSEGGFRIVNNCGADARQSVDHVHLHVLGGKQLKTTFD